jgi:cytochrome c oxidase assembly protein subunit 15
MRDRTFATWAALAFGAFVRLSNAGLSCPDWPTCYGRITWPVHDHEVSAANQAFPERPVETDKAWREQAHRFLAGGLGLIVFGLALAAVWRRPAARYAVLGAAAIIGVSIPLYIKQQYVAASAAALAGEALLLWRWLDARRDARMRTAVLVLAVICLQAVLGLWTVTWKLKPIVVMAHLLGGLTTFALLWWLALREFGVASAGDTAVRRAGVLVGIVLVSIQIALGGWTSANYAALACGLDYPRCLGQWWPPADFREAFVLWRGIGVDYEGGVLDGPARAAIQLAHRWFAVLVAGHVLGLTLAVWRRAAWNGHALALGAAVAAQIALGIANVLYGLPLLLAVAHNAVAALLLAVLIALLARVTPNSRR